MVTTNTVQDRGSHLLGDPEGLLTLQVRSPEHNGRVLRIRSPKCLIGSHPSCTLRLRGVGVRPFHCLILRGSEGMFIRRWSAETCLNGAAFTDARLKSGDRLQIGPVELEVLDLSQDQGPRGEIESGVCCLSRLGATATSSQTPADTGPQAGHSLPDVCQKCGGERQELEVALCRQVELSDREQGKWRQKYVQLIEDLKRADAACQDLLADTEKQTDQLHQTRSGYRGIIDELREDLGSLKQRHDTQLSEQAKLVAEAAEAEEHATRLAAQARELQHQVRDAGLRVEAVTEQLRVQRAEHDQQLAAAQTELLQERQDRQTRCSEWEMARHQLNEQLQQVRQQVDEARVQLESSSERSAELETKLRESTRQQQESVATAQQAAQRMRQYEDELATLRRALLEPPSECGEQQQDQRETPDRQLTEQLQHQLDDATAQLEACRRQSGTVDAELEELRQSHQRSLGCVRQREEELASLRKEFDQQRQQGQQQREQWESEKLHMQQEAREADGRAREALDNHAATASRVSELQSQLHEMSQKYAALEQTDRNAERQRDEIVAELSQWKDVAENLRLELQQEREGHRRVRNEWHVDREGLQRELAERSASLEQLQAQHNQEMQEAEFLIHSLQQEGKQLLSQLDEAKQLIRKDVEKRRKGEPPSNEASAAQRELPSRCQTMPMPAVLAGADPDAEQPRQEAQPSLAQAAEISPLSPIESKDASGSHHTLTMSPTELLEADEAAHPNGGGADQEREVGEPIEKSCPEGVSPAEEPVQTQASAGESPAEKPSLSQTADHDSTSDQPVRDELSGVPPQADELPPGGFTAMDDAAVGPPTAEEPRTTLQRASEILAGAPAVPEPEDEEGVIQQYMERLLKRVASHGREVVDEPSVEDRSQAPLPKADVVAKPAKAPLANDAASAEVELSPGDHSGAENVDAAEGESPKMLASRPPTPEMTADLLALRELANHSTRQAIHSSDRRRSLAVAAGELLVSSVCLTAGALLIAVSPKLLDSQMMGGAIGAAFGFSMLVRGSWKMLKCLSLKRELPGDVDSQQASEY